MFGFDHAIIIQVLLNDVLGKILEIHFYVDSKTLFNVSAKDSSALEKRIQIHVCSIKQSAARGEIKRLVWIPGNMNIADGLTK